MWKTIPGFENYMASDTGQIKSIERKIVDSCDHEYTLPEKILKPYKTKNGYLMVQLRKNGKTIPQYVHRLIALAFLPKDAPSYIVNHIDGIKDNCNLNNLEWVSYHENNQHAYDMKLHGSGEWHYNSKLTEVEVRAIRHAKTPFTYHSLARKYNVAPATIRDIVLNKTWKNVY